MAKLFQRRTHASPAAERLFLVGRYRVCRYNLLAVALFTILNTSLLLFGVDFYLLFSATIPYYLVMLGLMFCGKFPPEFYEGVEMEFFDSSFLVVMIVLALLLTLLYLLCFFLSDERRSSWLVVAAVLFTLDTVGMLLFSGFSSNMLFDLLFHGWVLYYLFAGISAEKRLKVLAAQNPLPASQPTEIEP